MNCPNCQTPNPPEARFCFNCGQSMRPDRSAAAPLVTPPIASNDLLNRYIPRELLAKLEAARQGRVMQGERRVVTIMFCDVKGSTAAAARLDPEEWAEIINGAFKHMIEPVYRYEGTVARLQGDGLLAFFGAPIAHEDDPQRALLAGLGIIQAIQDYRPEVQGNWGIDFNVRVGINTGLVVVGEVGSDLRVEYTALGDAINLAARMEQNAQPGTVLVADSTYKLVAPLFDFQILEDLQVKGYDEPVTAFRLLARKADPGRLRGIAGLDAPLVGRQAQMGELVAAWDEVAHGRGQIVSVIGEAGLGKSRLITEFRKELSAQPVAGWVWLEGRSLSYETGAPFTPFKLLLRSYFQLKDGHSGALGVAQLQSGLAALFPGEADGIIPFLASLLELPLEGDDDDRVRYLEPPVLRKQIFLSVQRLIARLSAAGPVVLCLDDLHWADSSSLELLASLLPLTDHGSLMILTAFRPHLQEPSWIYHETTGRDYAHRYHLISLVPLDVGQSNELIGRLLEIEDLPSEVHQKILEKSEGNPFFMEEVIRSLLDRGLVVRVDGHWRATREIHDITLPDTLQGVITARLDRLDDHVKYILQAAAVIGREFTTPVLADVLDVNDGLEPALVELQRRELVRKKTSLDGNTYIFKHVLTQEAAYGSILLSTRRELHRRAAESLITYTPDMAATIARHLLEARQMGRALPYLVTAGDRAARAYASAQAIDYYQQALDLVNVTSDMQLIRRVYEGMAATLTFAGQIEEAQELYKEMLRLGEAAGDVLMQISALNKQGTLNAVYLGQFSQAEALLDRAEHLSKQYQENSLVPETTLIRCMMCTARADFESVTMYMGDVIQLSKETGSKEQAAFGLDHIANSLLYLARFDEARSRATEGLELSRQVGDREHEASLLWVLGNCDLRDGLMDSAIARFQESYQIGKLIGSIYALATGGWSFSLMHQAHGNYDVALQIAQEALQGVMPFEASMPFLLVPLLGLVGSLYLEISPEFHDQSIDLHQRALRLLETPAGRMAGAPAWADLGLCAITTGDLDLAEQVLQTGLNYPNMLYHMERPRILSGAALLALKKGDLETASRQALASVTFSEEHAMRNHEPFSYLVLGRVNLAAGKYKQVIQYSERAEATASALGMRPIVWQADHLTAAALAACDLSGLAQAKLDKARMVVQEIAASMEAENLKQAYLVSTLRKLSLPVR